MDAIQSAASDSAPPPSKPEAEPAAAPETRSDNSHAGNTPLTTGNIAKMWQAAANKVGDVTADMASQFKAISLKGNVVNVTFGKKHICEYCRKPDRIDALKSALTELSGTSIVLQFDYEEKLQSASTVTRPKLSRVQMIRQLEQNALVKSAIEVFDAEVVEFRDLKK